MFSKKEKPLSREQAIKAAISELSLSWFFGQPYFACVENETTQKKSLVALNPDISKRNVFIALIDSTSIESHVVIEMMRRWKDVYKSFQIEFLLVFLKTNEKFSAPERPLEWLKQMHIDFNCFFDKNDDWGKAFPDARPPTLLHVFENEIKLSLARKNETDSLIHFLTEAEKIIQNLIWETNKGAALPALGIRRVLEKKTLSTVHLAEEPIKPGSWEVEDGFLKSVSHESSLTLPLKLSNYALVGGRAKESDVTATVYVELGGKPIFQEYRGADVKTNTEGFTCVDIQGMRPYEILKNVPLDKKDLRIFMIRDGYRGVHLLKLIGFCEKLEWI